MKFRRLLSSVMLMLVFGWACGVKMSPQPPVGGVPPQVERPVARPRESGILLTWKAPQLPEDSKYTKAVAFKIERRVKAVGKPGWSRYETIGSAVPQAKGDIIRWRDVNVEPGVEYQYRVCGVDEEGKVGMFSKAVSTRWETPPAAPVELIVEPSDRSVILRWSPPAAGRRPDGYFVYRAEDNRKNFQLITPELVPGSEFIDTGLKNGVAYCYTVRAARAAGEVLIEGPPSVAVEAVPADRIPPRVPVGVGAFITPEGVKVLWWPNAEPDLDGYYVYRSRGKNTTRLVVSPVKKTEYVDTSASHGNYYIYTVTAVDKAGNESPRSEPAGAYVK